MNGCKQPGGFTILEVLIVTAVSAVLFLVAASMIAGKQNKTGFTTSIYDFQTELQQISDDVINGYYPSFNSFSCMQTSTSSQPDISGTGSNNQGENGGLDNNDQLSGCTFMGKAVQFTNTSNGGVLKIYPVVGNLGGQNGQAVLSINDANPELLAPSSLNHADANLAKFVQSYDLSYGLDFAWMCYSTTNPCPPSSQTTNTGTVIFATSPSGSGVNQNSGTQEVLFIPVIGTDLMTINEVDNINNYFNGISNGSEPLYTDPAGGIEVCVRDNTIGASGLLTLGGNSSQPSINLQVKLGTKTCS